MVYGNQNVVIEDAQIGFRNFSGAEGEFNRAGDRNFSIFLPPEQAQAMERDGWNVKYLKVREPGDEPQAYLQVSVSYNPKAKPPKIVQVTSRAKNVLPEDLVGMLDFVDVKMCDVVISPYHWNVSGKNGIKAYLQTMYIVIHEDPLDLKWADISDGRALEATFNNGNVIQGELLEQQMNEIEF